MSRKKAVKIQRQANNIFKNSMIFEFENFEKQEKVIYRVEEHKK